MLTACYYVGMMKVALNLKQRHFNLDLHPAWINEAEGVAVFPLYNLSGQMVGYQQYRPDAGKTQDNHPKMSRYFTYRLGGVVGLWGLESWNASRVLFVTEGVFDAARLTSRGYSAVATLSNDPDPSTKRWFSVLRAMRPVVAVCDDDAAGRKLRVVGTDYHVMSGAHDLGDADDSYVTALLEQHG